MSTNLLSGTKLGNLGILTLGSCSPASSLNKYKTNLLTGCVPFTVCTVFPVEGWTDKFTAEEEVSRRMEYQKPVTPVAATIPGTAITTSSPQTPPPPPPPPQSPPQPPPQSPPTPPQQELSPNPTQRALGGPTPRRRPTTPEVPQGQSPGSPIAPEPDSTDAQQPSPTDPVTPRVVPPRRSPRSRATGSPGESGHLRACPSTDAFTCDSSAPFLAPGIKYLQTIPAGQHWTQMVISYLRFEGLPNVPGVSTCLSLFPIYTNCTIRVPIVFLTLLIDRSKSLTG